MTIIKRIEYKGQGIRIMAHGDKFKHEIAYFPKNRKCVFRQSQSSDSYSTQTEAIKVAKEIILTEMRANNWEVPEKPIDELLKEHYEHED